MISNSATLAARGGRWAGVPRGLGPPGLVVPRAGVRGRVLLRVLLLPPRRRPRRPLGMSRRLLLPRRLLLSREVIIVDK